MTEKAYRELINVALSINDIDDYLPDDYESEYALEEFYTLLDKAQHMLFKAASELESQTPLLELIEARNQL